MGKAVVSTRIERHGLGFCCRNDAEHLEDLLLRLLDGEIRVPPPLPGQVQQFSYREITRRLAKLFDEIFLERGA